MTDCFQSLSVGGSAHPSPEQHVNTAGDQPAPAASCVNQLQDWPKCQLVIGGRFQQNRHPFVASPDYKGSQCKIDLCVRLIKKYCNANSSEAKMSLNAVCGISIKYK